MKSDNLILNKTFQFGLRIIKLYIYLRDKKVDRVLTAQILRSGTSIEANTEETMGGSSKSDFIQKLRIAYREARETKYWIRLLKESNLLEQKLAESLMVDCDEILKILTSIINASKSKA